MTFPPRLPSPPRFLAEPLDRLRRRIDERLDNPGIPDFNLPPAVARIISRLPAQPPALALATALNLALDRILPRDSLEPLQGRWLRLVITDAGLTLDFHLAGKYFRPGRPGGPGLQSGHTGHGGQGGHSGHGGLDGRGGQGTGGKPDVTLTARTRDYLALALREEDADTLFFSRRLRMEGATHLGLLVKNTLDAVDWSAFRERLERFLPPRSEEAGRYSAV
jgi:predicted lipid carrier protein YhbT